MSHELKNNKSNLIENKKESDTILLLKKDLELLEEKSKNNDLHKDRLQKEILGLQTSHENEMKHLKQRLQRDYD